MDTIVVFDVNETLLDLSPVRDWFRARFGDAPDASMWFSELLRLSFVSSVTDRYAPFTDLAASALETVAERTDAVIDPADLGKIRTVLATLPPHPDAREGLASLRDNHFHIAALTNSPQSTAEAQLDNVGLARYFETIMSVEMVNRFKPHRSVYFAAAQRLGASPSNMVMVAAHDWDISGAMAAGLDGVFIERRGQLFSPSMHPPTLRARDLIAAAEAITEHYGS